MVVEGEEGGGADGLADRQRQPRHDSYCPDGRRKCEREGNGKETHMSEYIWLSILSVLKYYVSVSGDAMMGRFPIDIECLFFGLVVLYLSLTVRWTQSYDLALHLHPV